MSIARGPIRVGTPKKAKGYYPIAFVLSSSTASRKAMISTDKPPRSAAELYGERNYCSVPRYMLYVASQLDWAFENECG